MTHEPHTHRDYATLSAALEVALMLEASPVGVRIIHSAAEVSASSRLRPADPLSYCGAVSRAGRGESLLLDTAAIACDTSPRVLGLEPGFHDDDFIQSYVTCGLYRDRETADRMLADVPVLDGTLAILVRPLAEFTAAQPPHIVIVAVSPHGVMRLTQAAAYSGRRLRSDNIGMHGICAECTALPLVTGEACASMLCSAARSEGGWDMHHLGVGIPIDVLGEVVDGLLDSMRRYETDARKVEISRTCARRAPLAPGLADRVSGAARSGSYFERG